MHNAANHPDAIQKSFVKSIGQDLVTPLFFIFIISTKQITLTKSNNSFITTTAVHVFTSLFSSYRKNETNKI